MIKKEGMIYMKKVKVKPIKRIKLQRELRLSVIVVIGILIIMSAYSAYAAYQQPTTTEETQTAVGYTHTGTYNYNVYLTNNSLFATDVLGPGQGTFFEKLVDHINASYTYTFRTSQPSTIDGTYEVAAEVQTSMWTKAFPLVSKTNFNSSNSQVQFTINFPINTTRFEDYVTQINNETGVATTDSVLVITCRVLLSADTEYGDINEVFSPSIQVSLGGNIISIDGTLANTQTGTIETTVEVGHSEVITQRDNWTIASVLLIIILILFAGVTTTLAEPEHAAAKQFKKIMKKYGEWIVETDKLSPPKDAEIVSINSLDDLVKLSEELGKPVIHSAPGLNGEHTFYVFDDAMSYQYALPEGEQLKKVTRCPKCSTKITCEGTPGQKTQITCPSCGNKGTFTFEKTRKRFHSSKK
jgi:hypothetical protein